MKGMNTSQFLIANWTWDPAVCAAAAGLLIIYIAAFGLQKRLGYLLAGICLVAVTLLSPLNALANGLLFSAHMAQHILLLLGVSGLLLLGVPREVRLGIRRSWIGHPMVGWIAGVGPMWLWHAPALCNAAVSSPAVHSIQTVSLVLCGVGFWCPILGPAEEERLSPPNAVLYLFTACVACSLLGIIITLSPVAVCPIYSIPRSDPTGTLIRESWRITAEGDQQLGGLLMWVPMCLIYLGAIFFQIVRWYAVQPQSQTSQTSQTSQI